MRARKTGRAVRGWAEIEVRAEGAGSYVVWREELRPRGVPRVAGGVVRFAGRRVFGRVLDALLAPDGGRGRDAPDTGENR